MAVNFIDDIGYGGVPTANSLSTCVGIPPSQTIIGGAAPSGPNYQWQANSNGAGFTNIGGATAQNYTISSAFYNVAGTHLFRRVISSSTAACDGNSDEVTLTVISTGLITVTGGGAACVSTILNASGGTGGTIYYQGTTSGGTSTADPSTSVVISSAGTYYFRAQTPEGCWGPETATIVTIVQPPPATAATVCQDGPADQSMTATNNCAAVNSTAGPNFAGAGANNGTGTAWLTPGNITANDANMATASVTAGGIGTTNATTQALRATNFGFSIPAAATIQGITARISRLRNNATLGNVTDNSIMLLKAGSTAGSNLAIAASWPTTEAFNDYGGAANLWGTSWTPADINNNTGFGVSIVANLAAAFFSSTTGSINYVQVTITYSLPGTLEWYTVASGGSPVESGTTSFNPINDPEVLASGAPYSSLNNTATAGIYQFWVACSNNASCRTQVNYTIMEKPTAEAVLLSPATICQGDIVELAGTVTGAGTSPVTWTSSGTGTFSNANSLSTTYTPSPTETGTITFTLTTNDPAPPNPCGPASDQVSVVINETPVANAGPDQFVCSANTIQLNGTITGTNALPGTWSGGLGTFSPNANTLNAIYIPDPSEIGTTVTLTLSTNTNVSPCLPDDDQMLLTINESPDSTFTGTDGIPDPVCANSLLFEEYAAADGLLDSYLWTITGNGTAASNDNEPVFSVQVGAHPTNDFTLTLTVTKIYPNVTCQSQSSVTVDVGDEEDPQVVCPYIGEVTRIADLGECGYTVDGAEFDATASDNCDPNPTLTYALTGATIGSGTGSLDGIELEVGTTTITWTATDEVGNDFECSFDVTVTDTQAPVITCPVAINANRIANAGVCSYTAVLTEFDATATDNCAVTSLTYALTGATTGTGTTLAGVVFNGGVTTVTWTALDAAGNDAICSFTVTVLDDQDPVITCPVAINANRSANAGVCSYTAVLTEFDATATDNCAVTSLTYALTGATTGTGTTLAGVVFNSGVTTVTWTALDAAGNDAICSFTVTVIDDLDPVITCPFAINANRNANTGVCNYTTVLTEFDATATDNCAVTSLTYALTGATTGTGTTLAGVVFNSGVTTVTWTALDAAGNDAICSFTVTVLDAQDPVITCPFAINANRNANAGVCSYTAVLTEFDATATDNCAVTSLTYALTGATTGTGTTLAGVVFNSGVTTVTWTALDAAGNDAICSFTVTVIDNIDPVITCPVAINANRNANTGVCSYTAVLTEFDATATDNCAVTSLTYALTGATTGTGTTLAGVVFNGGVTTVTWTALDAAGNDAICSFTVTVLDDQDPVITCPVAINANRSANAGVCSYTAVLTEFDATATDNCAVTSLTYALTGATTGTGTTLAGVVFNSGVTTVTWTALDAAGNDAICSFTVTVIDDLDPVITCPFAINANRNANTGVCNYTTVLTEFDATATDNCAVTSLTYALTGATTGTGTTLAGVMFNSGVTTVTWTALDAAGNDAICSFTVTVLDAQDPVITCPFAINANRNANAGVCSYTAVLTEFDATATDNCAVTSLTYALTGATTGTGTTLAGVVFNSGVTTVTWTALDAAGNDAICSFTVTVIDNIDPVITCPVAINANRNANAGVCSYTAVLTEFDATATDNCAVTSLTYALTGATTGTGTTLAGVVFNGGVTTVTWTASDAAGNTDICSFTVTVLDAQDPVITCPVAINANRNANAGVCSYTAVLTEFDATATDNCAVTSLTYALTGATTGTGTTLAGVVFNSGVTTVTWTALDAAGNDAICSFTVTVIDNIDPVITCPFAGNTNRNAGGIGCNYIAVLTEFDATATDNCAVTSLTYALTGATTGTGTTLAGVVFNGGVTTVTWTASDAAGNTDICSFTVTVLDAQDPVITCPVTGNANRNVAVGVCNYVIQGTEFNATATDNCGYTLSYVLSGATTGSGTGSLAGVTLLSGVTTITWTVTDGAGNTDVCSFTVTVIDDEDPVIHNLPASFSVNNLANNCLAMVTWTAPNATDNCGTPTLTSSDANYNTLHFTLLPVGVHTITYTATDAAGNTATASFTVTVVDNQPPTFSFCPGNITVNTGAGATNCGATVTVPTPAATDNCPASLSMTGARSDLQPLSATYPVGITTVTWTATDGTNTATCAYTVTVIDNTKPLITSCPGNINTNNDPGQCGAIVNFAATATDNCPGVVAITYSKNPGTLFPIGTTTVTVTATDVNNNVSTCTFTVTVNDTQVPLITCPGDITANAPAGLCNANVTIQSPTVTDNCAAFVFGTRSDGGGLINGPFPKTVSFPVGTTTITWIAMDGSFNQASCIQTIIVKDVTAPTITCPGTISINNTVGQCGASVNPGTATATDDCTATAAIIIIGVRSDGFALNAMYPAGTTTITWTATDGSGNTAQCTQSIIVTEAQVPVITCNPAINVFNDVNQCGASLTIPAPLASDNCPGVTVTGVRDDAQPLGAIYPIGQTIITWTAEDASNNTAFCTQIVNVVDQQDPTIFCPGNITMNVDPGQCSAVVTYTAVTLDNCPGATVSFSPISGSTFTLGNHTVIATATDASGNTAICAFTVTVVDNEPPSITCPSNITMPNAPNQCGAIVTFPAATAQDNCAGVTIGYSPSSGSFFPVGTTQVTATATDQAGNTSSCSFTVTVQDTQAPTINCPVSVSASAEFGLCGANVPFVVTYNDNCGGATVQFQSHQSGSFFPVGTTLVTVIVQDLAGNTNTCSFNVTVTDNQAPTPNVASLPTIIGTCTATASAPTATDNCDGTITGTTTDPTTYNSPGTYTITWKYTDLELNSITQTQLVIVNSAPAVINTQPADESACVGEDVTLSIDAIGDLQWQVNTGSGFVNILELQPHC